MLSDNSGQKPIKPYFNKILLNKQNFKIDLITPIPVISCIPT